MVDKPTLVCHFCGREGKLGYRIVKRTQEPVCVAWEACRARQRSNACFVKGIRPLMDHPTRTRERVTRLTAMGKPVYEGA